MSVTNDAASVTDETPSVVDIVISSSVLLFQGNACYRTRYPGAGRLRAAIETHAVSAASSPAAARRGGLRLGRATASPGYHPRGRRRRGAGHYGDYREGRHTDHRDDRG